MAIAENEAPESSTSDPFPRGRAILSLIVASIGSIFLLDVVTPLGVPVWVLYLIPLILTYRTPYTWIPYLTAGVCAILTLLCLALSGPMTSLPSWMPLLNRAAALGMFAVIAHLIVQYRRATERLIQTAALDAEHKALQLKESLLLKNAQDVQDLYDHAPCGYHSLNSQGMFVGINQTELDWLGYRKDEVIGKIRFLDLLTPESAELFHQQFPRFIERGIVRDLEFEIRRKDGSLLPVLLSATAIKEPDGRFIASRSTLVDITERRKADVALRQSHQTLEVLVKERTAALEQTNRRLAQELAQSNRIQTALADSEGRFRELVECLPQPIWTCLPEGECDYLSPQWMSYTGMPAAGQLGHGWTRQVHSEDRQMAIEQWQEALARAQPFDSEFRLRRADGTYRWFHAHASPLRDNAGRLLRWLGTFTEIHDRKQAESMQARLAAIVESSSDAVISKSLDGRILTWNKSAELMFGYSGEEIIGQSIFLLIPSDRQLEETTLIELIKTGKRVQQYETIRRRKGGSCIQVSLTVSPIMDANGLVNAVSTIARDITARKQTEEMMTQQRRLIELSYEPIFAWEIDQGIVEWNRGCEQLYGYTRSEALGHSSNRLLQSRLPAPLGTIQAELEQTGEWTGEIHHRTKDGRDVLVASRWGLLKTNGRSLVLETNRDITQLRQSETMILKKNKDLETLLYVTSHDLKEPLRAIESFSVLIQERYANRLDEKGQDFLRRIVRATQRLDQLLTDILDLSRAQRMDPPVDDIDAEQLVHEVLRRLEKRIKETDARITIRSPLPRLRVNTTWAIQGIYNLVANALKFASAGQAPDIEIAPHSGMDLEGNELIGLVVRDRGPGVAPEQRDRIFELFRRAVGREIEGTGAGLAIVRQVAERHGGRAWVEPREGGGSEFFITFGVNQSSPRKVQR
ncbi:MAG: PAS domain S-box protein [Nitrospira sp.]|nr:MAG: PAS domain S-box protein [Nitrospira sp.]